MAFPSASANKKLIYACKPSETVLNRWEEPIPLRVKVSYLNTDVDVMAYGTNVNSYMRMNGTKTEIGFLNYQVQPKKTWRFYIDKPLPLEHDPTQQKADGANYEMEVPQEELSEIVIMLKRLTSR